MSRSYSLICGGLVNSLSEPQQQLELNQETNKKYVNHDVKGSDDDDLIICFDSDSSTQRTYYSTTATSGTHTNQSVGNVSNGLGTHTQSIRGGNRNRNNNDTRSTTITTKDTPGEVLQHHDDRLESLYEEIEGLKKTLKDVLDRMDQYDNNYNHTHSNDSYLGRKRSQQTSGSMSRENSRYSSTSSMPGFGIVQGMHSYLKHQIQQRLSITTTHTPKSTHYQPQAHEYPSSAHHEHDVEAHDRNNMLQKKTEGEADYTHITGLSPDTFSLMKVKPVCSRSWLFSFGVYLTQLLLLSMIFIEQCNSSANSSPFNIPFQVGFFARLGQCVAIIIAISVSKDLFIPIKELSNLNVSNSIQWSKVIGVQENSITWSIWIVRMAAPNVMQFVLGCLALLVSFIIICQSDNVIQLFADFAAMSIIAEIDDIAFWFAESGYVGDIIRRDTIIVKEMKIEDKTKRRRTVLFFVLLLIMIISFVFVVQRQLNGHYFRQVYPACKIPIEQMSTLGDNECNGGFVNSFVCGFDDGDCLSFNIAYPTCDAVAPAEVGDGICQPSNDNESCGYDGGDCCPKKLSTSFGDGECHAGLFNTKRCLYDNGDCDKLRRKYPACPDYDGEDIKDSNGNPIVIGNGICDLGKEYLEHYMNEDCGWVFGDCLDVSKTAAEKRENYPSCKAKKDYFKIGNGICDGGEFLTEECGWEQYDCCDTVDVEKIGDGVCDGEMFGVSYLRRECGYEEYDCCNRKSLVNNGKCDIPAKFTDIPTAGGSSAYSAECGWDGHDCIAVGYPECQVRVSSKLGDGLCDGGNYNTKQCGWDGGDCTKWNEDFPNCKLSNFGGLGDGLCHANPPNPSYLSGAFEVSNSEDCGWDGGDCLLFNAQFPQCNLEGENFEPFRVGDGFCNVQYNNTDCGYDGGDCLDNHETRSADFKASYPYCAVSNPYLIGDGICNGYDDSDNYNTRECGFDGGDCIVFNAQYKGCSVAMPSRIGDGRCDGEDYNTEQCGWDGGDCTEYNTLYPDCDVKEPSRVGDGSCNFEEYNTEECKWDGGDCEKYKDCKAFNRPFVFISNGICDGGSYNTKECQWDGGDCLVFRQKYPKCKVLFPSSIGNGKCDWDPPHNTEECGWDGGDCINHNKIYSNCTDGNFYLIGNGRCDIEYNTVDCNFDGGDCAEFNERYPNCTAVEDALTLGNLKCDVKQNNAECGFDGGDCNLFNKNYPNCTVEDPSRIGNGKCDGGVFNTEECGFDGSDCWLFNSIYPGCFPDDPSFIADGGCDGGMYNTPECKFDGGDCIEFNKNYPNCTVPYPSFVGTGWCDDWNPLYNTSECGYDGGDCLV